MAIRELRLYGDEIFKKTCKPVPEINDHIRLLLDDMADTLNAMPDCAILAANQLGIMRRLIVTKNDSATNGGVTAVTKLVNPVITEQIGEQDCLESCISIKNISGMTIRPQKIVIEAQDEFGNPITITAEDETAQLLCRGIDYLDGKVFVNHVYRFVTDEEESI